MRCVLDCLYRLRLDHSGLVGNRAQGQMSQEGCGNSTGGDRTSARIIEPGQYRDAAVLDRFRLGGIAANIHRSFAWWFPAAVERAGLRMTKLRGGCL